MRFAGLSRLVALAAIMLGFLPCGARADVTYNFITTSHLDVVGTNNGIPYDSSGFTGLPLSLVFTDAGVASGEVSGFEENDFPTADVFGLAGFVSLTIGTSTYTDTATLGALAVSLGLDVRFGSDGQITGASIQYSNNDLSFDLEGTSVTLSSDGVLGCLAPPGSEACTASGYFAVPEPAPFTLFLASLVGVAAAHRRGGSRRAARFNHS
jgi:hypothetical protein